MRLHRSPLQLGLLACLLLGACDPASDGSDAGDTDAGRTDTPRIDEGDAAQSDAGMTPEDARTDAPIEGPIDGGGTCPTLLSGIDPIAPSAMGTRPEVNAPYRDERFGTLVRRVTDGAEADDRDPPSWVRHEYSRRASLNVDGTRALMISSNGWMRLYAVDSDGRYTFDHTLSLSDTQEGNWHPTDPDVVRFVGRNGDGMTIQELDVATDAIRPYRDLSARIRSALGSTARSAWTKGEGRPSTDGRLWCFMVDDASFRSVGLVAYDAIDDRILGTFPTTDRPDHISASPLGNYCVPSWTSSLGTRAYATDFSEFTQLHDRSEHSDLAVTAAGREVLVYSSYASGFVEMVDLASGDHTELFSLYGPNHSATAMHLSGASSDRPGWVVASFYACTEDYGSIPCDPTTQWFMNQVVLVELSAEPRILRLAHTHYGDAGYFAETQAVTNRDLSRVTFASTWGSSTENDVASYVIEIPTCALTP
jgi:hypothetical protein